MSASNKRAAMVLLIVVGCIFMYLNYFISVGMSGILFSIWGLGLILWGSYLWVSLKNRLWVFMFWGLLAPFGLIGIALLKDKSEKPEIEVEATEE